MKLLLTLIDVQFWPLPNSVTLMLRQLSLGRVARERSKHAGFPLIGMVNRHVK
jgi:hypothetical protein